METGNYTDREENRYSRRSLSSGDAGADLEGNSIGDSRRYAELSSTGSDYEGRKGTSSPPVRCNSLDDMFAALRNGMSVEIEEEILRLHDESFGSANCPDNPGMPGRIGIVRTSPGIDSI